MEPKRVLRTPEEYDAFTSELEAKRINPYDLNSPPLQYPCVVIWSKVESRDNIWWWLAHGGYVYQSDFYAFRQTS